MSNIPTPLEAARSFRRRGWMPLPVPFRSKSPGFKDWQHFTTTESDLPLHFNGQQQNVGVLLGKPSGDLVDVDLDCAEAVALAPLFLLATGATFGRRTRPRSHWLYVALILSKVTFTDPITGNRLVEILTNGQQAIFPGSTHKDTGEPIRWHEEGEPARVDAADLLRAVKVLAAATLLALHWPQQGSRQDAALALAGGLLRAGWREDEAARFIEAVCNVARDEETRSRVRTVVDTAAKLKQGAHVTGWPKLAGIVDKRAVDRAREWLDMKADALYEESEKPDQWEQPAAFYEHDLPDFPASTFPAWLRAFVQGLARETQTPVDLSALLTLSVCAGAVAGRARVQARPGWDEPLNLYTVTAMSPGNRKSAVFVATCEPLEETERALVEETRDEIAEAESERRMLEERRNRLEKEAAKIDDLAERTSKREEAIRLSQELAVLKVPATPRLIVADVTPEALASLLAEQGGRMCLFSPEGDLFDMLAGRYTGGAPNFDVILKGHSGDALRVDRRGRSEHVPRPALTIGLTVQPDVIRGLVDKPGFRGRGLIGRFLYSLPKSTVGRRQIAPEPLESGVRQTYGKNVKALADVEAAQDYDGLPVARMLYLTAEANDLLKKFEAELEPQLAEDGELGAMADWAAKLAGAVVRIASILHLAEHAQRLTPWPERVAAETMSRAIEIGHYFIPHARAAFAEMGADLQIENAKRLLRWIERTEQRSFSKRDAHQAHRGQFKKVTDIEPALELLEAHGYIRARTGDTDHRPGRKPSQVYDVNPFFFSQSHNTHNTQNSAADGNFEDFENCESKSSENFSALTSDERNISEETASPYDEEEADRFEPFPPGWLCDLPDETRELAAILESYGLSREGAARAARECFAPAYFRGGAGFTAESVNSIH